ncbi:AAA family ATPase ['Camptotheca acuminata' phytoplasma]|uniref:AAA family ATPase n=1 Tax='Camptotheca acuminata' phytoplasma TaxID=3239192 RepID=UPI00351A205E
MEKDNETKWYNKIFSFSNFLFFILFFVSFILIFYILQNHKKNIQNENNIEYINKNILKLEKFNNYMNNSLKNIKKDIELKEQQGFINDSQQSENKPSKNPNEYEKNIFLKSENFVAKNYDKFPSFNELSSLKEPKAIAKGFINFFKNKESFKNRGKVSVPTGLMMYGTPGCGKTIFAGSISREAEVPFIEVSCSIFAQELVGKAPKMVKELFDLAKEVAVKSGKGAIIFLDECENIFLNIDSLKPGSEIANVVNEFKIQLEPRPEERNLDQPIFVIGATNHIDGIESAILSRFTHRIELTPGTQEERKEQLNDILKYNQFPITKEAKEFLLENINLALEFLPLQYEKNINGLLVEIPIEKHYKKAYRVLESLVKEASLASIDREITNSQGKKECLHPEHKERFENNKIFFEKNKQRKKTEMSILGNCCECKSINTEDLKKAYRVIIDETLISLEKAENVLKLNKK